jgi:hypothetical protein
VVVVEAVPSVDFVPSDPKLVEGKQEYPKMAMYRELDGRREIAIVFESPEHEASLRLVLKPEGWIDG